MFEEVKATYYEDDGCYCFIIYTAESILDGGDNAIHIDIPEEVMGKKFKLTEDYLGEKNSWYIEFYDYDGETTYRGFGDEGDMEDVVSGTIYGKKLSDSKYELQFDIVFADGKRLKGNYKGETIAAGGYNSYRPSSQSVNNR